jgi:hypothetical protein
MTNQEKALEKFHNMYFENMPVRIVMDENGEPFWVAKDVCEILEYSDTEVALRKIDDDEKLIRKIYVSGQERDVWTINESGLYTLIIRSNKPQAKPFRRWVTHDVLPSIRKTGAYVHPGAAAGVHPEILEGLVKRLEHIDAKINQFQINSNQYGPVWAFVHERCQVGQAHVTEKEALYGAYVDYCREKNTHIETRNHFFMRLYHAVQSCYRSALARNGGRKYVVRGIAVKDDLKLV